MFLALFVAALGEELGWSGYAIDRMQARWNALAASLLLGLLWAAWHWVPLIQAHRPAAWIAWWSLYTVALRVVRRLLRSPHRGPDRRRRGRDRHGRLEPPVARWTPRFLTGSATSHAPAVL